MPTRSKRAAPAAQRPVDLTDEVRQLAKILRQYDLTSVEIESGQTCIRISREILGAPQLVTAPGAAAERPPVAAPAEATSAKKAASADTTTLITSPFVGTFYRAASPDSAPFVEVGQAVSKGTVLCIVEAMKLMNEIEAESACRIVEILVRNAEPVEYGQPLFRVQG